MPNGHGGVPYMGAPIFFAVFFGLFVVRPFEGTGWLGWLRAGVCTVFAMLLGWRLAYHLHMRKADEYGGGYTPPDAYQRAQHRYRIAAVLYTIISTSVGVGILWWRGFP